MKNNEKTVDELIEKLTIIKNNQGGKTVVKVWSDIEEKDFDIEILGFSENDKICRILIQE